MMLFSDNKRVVGGWLALGILGSLFSTQAVFAEVVPFNTSNIIADNFNFAHAPHHTVNADPAPYGTANNTGDSGWIWNVDAYLTVDFGSPQRITSLRPYSVIEIQSQSRSVLEFRFANE